MTLQSTARGGLFKAFAALILLLSVGAPALAQNSDYRLRPGDVLRIEVLEDTGLNRTALVAPDGRISVPLAGSVAASGRTVESVQGDLVAKLSGSFAAPPTVFVSIDRIAERRASTGGAGAPARATIEVFVLGEAAKPGRLEIRRGSTVLEAFAQMGGFTKFAAKTRVQLRRGGKIYALDYVAIESGRSAVGDTVLVAGDVILVPQRALFE
ncbi:MAG: polysaccharide biosynthesis/export family protein [Gemmobacter sp.]